MVIASAPPASSSETRQRMQMVARRDTPCELRVRRILFAGGLRYRIDTEPVRAVRRKADIVFPRHRLAIFIDGCFWHDCPRHRERPVANADWWGAKLERNRRRDSETNRLLREAGWTVLRYWEHEDPREVVAEIRRWLSASA